MSMQMKRLGVLILSFGVFLLTGGTPAFATKGTADLQRMLDAAAPGDLVTLPPGTYEGTLLITKPIQVVGEGTEIRSAGGASDQPLVRVETSGATVRGLRVAGDQLGILVHGNANCIREVTIQTSNTALKVENSHHVQVQHVQIRGRDVDVEERGNGMELWNSQDILVENTSVDQVQDGVYVDNCVRTVVRDSSVANSRYAVHIMFSTSSVVERNDLEHNVTGAMVMEDQGSRIVNNTITKQTEHAQSQGILLYHAQGVQVLKNRVEGNRIGLYVDSSTGNRVEENQVLHNFLGLQMKDSSSNAFHTNSWVGNVIQAQATGSHDNAMDGNYWDDFQGLDLDGDGHSELSYQASPLFLSLTEAVPAYQLFFQSPGIEVLQDLLTSDTENWLTDASPLLRPPEAGDRSVPPSRGAMLVISLLCLGVGLYPFRNLFKRRVSL